MASSKSETVLQALLVLSTVALGVVVWDALRDKVITVGDSAPSFQVQTDRGLTLSQSEFGGKLLVVNFWATWCPPCRKELPELEKLHTELADEGLVVLGISLDKNEQNYRNFVRNFRINFHTVREPEGKISGSFGTYRYPETYVINREGKVVSKIIAAEWTADQMIPYLKSML